MYESKQNLMQSSSNNSIGYTEIFVENLVSIHITN